MSDYFSYLICFFINEIHPKQAIYCCQKLPDSKLYNKNNQIHTRVFQ